MKERTVEDPLWLIHRKGLKFDTEGGGGGGGTGRRKKR
jgi:hypothetical protein